MPTHIPEEMYIIPAMDFQPTEPKALVESIIATLVDSYSHKRYYVGRASVEAISQYENHHVESFAHIVNYALDYAGISYSEIYSKPALTSITSSALTASEFQPQPVAA